MSHATKPKTGSFRVLVADDHLLIRQIIGAMLERDPNLSIVGEAAKGSEARSMATALTPDNIVMDITVAETYRLDELVETAQEKFIHASMVGNRGWTGDRTSGRPSFGNRSTKSRH